MRRLQRCRRKNQNIFDAIIKLGAAVDRITAAVGPCIAQESYEVGPDLRDAVLARSSNDSVFFVSGQRDDNWQFDLPGYCAARMRAAGVGHVIVSGFDSVVETASDQSALSQMRGFTGRSASNLDQF